VNLKLFDAALLSEVAGADREGQTDARGRSPLLLAVTPPKVERQIYRIVLSASPPPGLTRNVRDHPVSSRSWMRAEDPRCQFQSRESDRQLEAPRPDATRIKVEHSANRLGSRPMRVAGNDDVNAARGRVQPQLLNIGAARRW
jgi:hypothetical protein